MKNRNLKHIDDWATPKEFYDKLDQEFHFEYDPCPLFSPKDGLAFDWASRNFINPPYNRKSKEQFILKAIAESQKGNLCVMLLPVSTSTKIFHDQILPNAKEIRFVKGRIKFQRMDKKGELYTPKNGGMHDSMVVIFENKRKKKIFFKPI